MIANILLLLAANIMLPLMPIPPELLLTYPVYEYFNSQSTIYSDMNLERHYNPDEFKKSFRQSLKKFHPDRGGTAEHFAMIKAAKQIMQHKPNYYDLYNLTIVDLKRHQNIVQAADMKQLLFEFQTYLFYFIALLYFIAFTIDDKFRGLRKILIPLTIVSCAYELYIHAYPETVTLFDIIDGQMPLFVQSLFIKKIFAILTAVLRARKARSKDQELTLLEQVEKLATIQQYQPSNQPQKNTNNQPDATQASIKEAYLSKLKRLLEIYVQKVKKQHQSQKSWTTKIKNWISKGVSFAIIGLMIWGFISSGIGSSESFTPSKEQF